MGGLFEVIKLEEEKEKLENTVNKKDFWDDVTNANKTYQQLKSIKKILTLYYNLLDSINILKELLEIEM